MKCKKCKQEGSPIFELITKLGEEGSVTILSSCAGFHYEGHQNVPDRPFILFSTHSFRTLENLWQRVFQRLSVPTWVVYNGSRQFLFEIDLPNPWPQRDEVISGIWEEISNRVREFK